MAEIGDVALSSLLGSYRFRQLISTASARWEGGPPSSLEDVHRRYHQLNRTQRQAANFFLRKIQGVSWQEALRRADEQTLRSLARHEIVFLLPDGSRPQSVAVPLEYRFLFRHLEPEPETLIAALAHYDARALARMAEHYGIAGESGPVSPGVPSARCEIAAELHQRIVARAPQMFGGLPKSEWEVLDELFTGSSVAGLRRLNQECLDPRMRSRYARLGPNDLLWSVAAARENPIASLLLKGILGADGAYVMDGRGNGIDSHKIYIPAEIKPLLDAALKKNLDGAGIFPTDTKLENAPSLSAPAVSPEKVLSRAESFWRDLARLSIASLSVPLTRTRQGQVTQASLKKLGQMLGLAPGSLLDHLRYLVFHEMMAPSGNAMVPSAHWKEPARALDALASGYWNAVYKARSDGDDRSVRFGSSPRSKPDPLREAIVKRLLDTPSDRWTSREALSLRLMNDRKLVSRVLDAYFELNYVSEREYARRVGVLVERNCRFLHHVGLLETDEALSVVKPSSLLRSGEGGKPQIPPELTDPGMGLILQPNLEVLAPLSLSISAHAVLAAFGQLKSIEHLALYAFSPQTLYRGLETGLSLEKLTQTFSQHGKGALPPAFESVLEEVKSRSGEFLFIPAGFVVRVKGEHLGKVLEKMGAKDMGEIRPLEGASGFYRVSAGLPFMNALKHQLQRKGYFPIWDGSPDAAEKMLRALTYSPWSGGGPWMDR